MAGQRGKFITFEGGEGAGKSTQARMLKAALESRGREVVLTREPGGTRTAEEIRKLLVEGAPERWTPMSETLLFLAARADHVARLIEPAIKAGTWVISDRFSDSTFVYQGIARGLGVDNVRRISQASLGDFAPDLTLILDIDPEKGLARAGKRGAQENRFERFEGEFHAKLRDGFRDIAICEPERCVLIDAEGPPETVAASIWRIVDERLHP
jgi:dTMP kinase